MIDEWVTGKITLRVGGQPLNLEMTVPAKPVKLHRMLPVFQQMTSTFVGLGVQSVEAQGEKISCQAGCGACCRQAVPISEAEAYQIRELVENLPEPRQTEVRKRFQEGFEKIYATGWFEEMEKSLKKPLAEHIKVVEDYFRQGVACPFLENESCSIHESRPLACREYLVTSPPENCASPSQEGINNVEYPFKVSPSFIAISRTEFDKDIPFITLIAALNWAEKHPEKNTERTGEQWMALFFKHLIESQNTSGKK
jgi:Fe-S-cluster containining protein